MIADTTFLIHFAQEGLAARRGPARTFFAQQRSNIIRTSIVSVAVASIAFGSSGRRMGLL
jgi:hypothetical protein